MRFWNFKIQKIVISNLFFIARKNSLSIFLYHALTKFGRKNQCCSYKTQLQKLVKCNQIKQLR